MLFMGIRGKEERIMASDSELSNLSNLKVSALLNLLVEENMVLKKVEQRKSYFLLK